MPTSKATLWINGQRLALIVRAEGPCSAFLATGEGGGGVLIQIFPQEEDEDTPWGTAEGELAYGDCMYQGED